MTGQTFVSFVMCWIRFWWIKPVIRPISNFLTIMIAGHLHVVVGYPTPSQRWGHGGRPWSPRSRATPQGLDQRGVKSERRKESVAGQCRMRWEMSSDECPQALQERILDSANPREVRSWEKAVSVAAKTKEDTASMTREHKFLNGNRGNLCVKIL